MEYNFYNFDTDHPEMSLFDVSQCYTAQNTKQFQITFPCKKARLWFIALYSISYYLSKRRFKILVTLFKTVVIIVTVILSGKLPDNIPCMFHKIDTPSKHLYAGLGSLL